MNSSEQVAADTKEILHGFVHREKPLRARGRCEPAHLLLAVPRGLMRDRGAIVGVRVCDVDHVGHHRAAGG